MKNFIWYCASILALMATSLFLPFFKHEVWVREPIHPIPGIDGQHAQVDPWNAQLFEFTGMDYHQLFYFPLIVTVVILLLSFKKSLWTNFIGIILSFSIGLYTLILPSIMTLQENSELLMGYFLLLGICILFFLLNVLNTVFLAKNLGKRNS